MASGPLFARNFRGWLGARGFWMVVFASVLPLVLTGAWVGSHQADLKVVSFTADRTDFAAGDVVNLTAVVRNDGRIGAGAFNASIGVYGLVNGAFVASPVSGGALKDQYVSAGLEPGGSATLSLTWTAQPGVYLLLASADKPTGAREESGDVPEIEELNNFERIRSSGTQSGVFLVFPRADTANGPSVPPGLSGNASAANATDVVVELAEVPSSALPGTRVNVTATITNNGPSEVRSGTLRARVGTVADGVLTANPTNNRSRSFTAFSTLGVGNSTNLSFQWTASVGTFWVQAFYTPGSDLSDPDAADNHATAVITVNPSIPANVDESIEGFLRPYTIIPEKATIKSFYSTILENLHLRLIIPFIALFYAAGVIADDREKGNLVYLLTRPVDRWLIPLTKFAASFLVAGLAIVVGIVGTYALLFGTTSAAKDIGYLATPLLLSLAALFAYGGVFTLLGVLVERPYLVGVAFVIGWETVAGNFVEWVQNLTISGHLQKALDAWALDQGFLPWPQTADGARELQIVVVAGVAALVAASMVMKRREFEV